MDCKAAGSTRCTLSIVAVPWHRRVGSHVAPAFCKEQSAALLLAANLQLLRRLLILSTGSNGLVLDNEEVKHRLSFLSLAADRR